MSYDVIIGDYDANITYNVSEFFYDHIDGGILSLHGMKGKKAFKVLRKAFDNIDKTRYRVWKDGEVGERSFCKIYDSENGWGSTVGAIMFLAKLMAACADNPRSKIVVC